MSVAAAQMLIGAQLVELQGRPKVPFYTPTEVSDLLLDIWLLLDIEPEFSDEDCVVSPEILAEEARLGFLGVT